MIRFICAAAGVYDGLVTGDKLDTAIGEGLKMKRKVKRMTEAGALDRALADLLEGRELGSPRRGE